MLCTSPGNGQVGQEGGLQKRWNQQGWEAAEPALPRVRPQVSGQQPDASPWPTSLLWALSERWVGADPTGCQLSSLRTVSKAAFSWCGLGKAHPQASGGPCVASLQGPLLLASAALE